MATAPRESMKVPPRCRRSATAEIFACQRDRSVATWAVGDSRQYSPAVRGRRLLDGALTPGAGKIFPVLPVTGTALAEVAGDVTPKRRHTDHDPRADGPGAR